MKKTLIAILISTSLLGYADVDKDAKSSIKNVNVYLNRAQISRSARVAVSAGITNVTLSGLTMNLDKNSIQVAGKGKFVIMGVQHKVDYLNKNAASEQAIELKRKIDALNLSNRKLNQKKQVLIEEKELLLQNRKIGGQNNGVSALELEKVTMYFRKRRNEIDELYVGYEQLVLKNNKKVQAFRNELNQMKRNANTPSSGIVVSVSSKAAQTITLNFDYMVYNAGWVPLYDIRAKEGNEKVQLNYKANIYQNTGIDWKNVNLTISTGNPAQGGTKPKLSPWYLRILQAVYNNRSRSAYGGAAKPSMKKMAASPAYSEDEFDDWGAAEEEMGEPEPVANSIAQYTTVSESNLATTFSIALKQNIPSDNKKHMVSVQQLDLNSSFNHAAVPKLDKDAFLLAQLTGWEQYNLLSGNSNVYYDGAYVGQTYVDMTNPSDTLAISLGRDKKVVITREKIKNYCKTKTFGANIKKTTGYEITIRNTKNKAVDVTVEDQYPISNNSEIIVELLDKSGAKVNKTKGFVTWNISLKPGETKKVQLKYEVKYPKKLRISNL